MNEKDRYYLSKEDIAKLAAISETLNPGEKRNITVYHDIISNEDATFKVSIYLESVPKDKENYLTTSKRKIKNSFHLLKEKIVFKFNSLAEKVCELMLLNEAVDLHLDKEGQYYYLESDTKVYVDQRGFEYYQKYIPSLDKKINYMMLNYENGEVTFGTFIDDERTLILVDGEVYEVNNQGELSYNDKIINIGPRL